MKWEEEKEEETVERGETLDHLRPSRLRDGARRKVVSSFLLGMIGKPMNDISSNFVPCLRGTLV